MKLPSLSSDHFKTIDLKSFGVGLAAVCGLYVLIFVYVFISANNTLSELEGRLSSFSALIAIENKNTDSPSDAHKNENILIGGLLEKADEGNLPIVRKKDGLTSFRAYQLPFDFKKVNERPVVVFVVKDFGLSAETSQSALDLLPPEVGFILSPYSTLPEEWIRLARESHHEIWLNTPIENKELVQNDTGSATIMIKSSYVQKLSALHWTLARGSGFIGVSAHSDDMILESKEQYSNLVDEIYNRGLGYLELNPNANSFIQSKALTNDAPYVKADMEVLRMTGENSFEQLEDKLNENGVIVAVIPNFPNQIKNLATWILKNGQSNYTLAPASAMYDIALHQSSAQKAATVPNNSVQEGMNAATNNLKQDDMVSPPENQVQHQ